MSSDLTTAILILLLLNTTCPVLANSVDPDQLASEKANWSGSALFGIKYVNMWISINHPDQVIWLAGNYKWAWHLNLFSKARVNPFRPAIRNPYLCKQCRSRCDGSWKVVSSGSTLFVIVFIFLDWNDHLESWSSPCSSMEVHFRKLRMKGLKCVVQRCKCIWVAPNRLFSV